MIIYIDDSVSVENPHNSRSGESGDAAAEASPFSFHHIGIFGLQDEDGSRFLFLFFDRVFRKSNR